MIMGETSAVSGIPRRRVPISLEPAIPTKLTVEGLKSQLTAIGLTCPAADEKRLVDYIADVKAALPSGAIQTYSILRPTATTAATAVQGLATGLGAMSDGNWQPDATGLGYMTELGYIQHGDHFKWLKDNLPGFSGTIDEPPVYHGTYDTIDAVKSMFATVGTVASSTLVKGLDKDSIESVLSRAIAPLNDANAKDYNPGPDSCVIFLVDNYNSSTQEADAFGVLSVEWELKISDYKEKKKNPQHATTLTVKTRAVLYDSLDDMNRDLLAARTNFKANAFASFKGIPVRPATVKIFDAQPPADEDTFRHSLPLVPKTNFQDVIVMYAPDLQNIGSIDNTKSQVTTTFEKSITTGFTFSTGQTIGTEAKFDVSAIVATAEVSVSFSLSFTEEWSKSTTESMSFSVPPGEKAFTYQGTVVAARLRFDSGKGTFTYLDKARCLTTVLATTTDPIVPAGS